jgi:histone H3/H4
MSEVGQSEGKSFKKAASPYFVFLQEFRTLNQAKYSSVGEFAKSAGAKWKLMSEEEKQVYKDKAEEIKKSIPKEQVEDEEEGKKKSLLFPLATVKRIVKLDPEVKNISKDALMMITKAAECFIETCAQRTSAIAKANKKKTIDASYLCNGEIV